MVKTHLLRREKSGQRRGRSVKLISMEESWKASTFLTSNFSLDFSKRPVSTAYVDAVQNEKRELLLWDVRVWYPLTPFVEWDFHKLGVALRWIGKIPSNVAILDTEIKNRILIIVYLSPSHQLPSTFLRSIMKKRDNWKGNQRSQSCDELHQIFLINSRRQQRDENFDGLFARASSLVKLVNQSAANYATKIRE